MPKQIPLTQGMFAIVDDADFGWLSKFKWHAHKVKHTWYARSSGKSKMYMHRMILNPAKNKLVDHRDGNGLNNRRENIRECDRQKNVICAPGWRQHSAKYKGVGWSAGMGKWEAFIRIDGKKVYLGCHGTPEIAARVYDAKAKELFGDFAYQNFKEAV